MTDTTAAPQGVTIIIHGPYNRALQDQISEAFPASGLPREQRRRIAYLNGTLETPASELLYAGRALLQIAEELRSSAPETAAPGCSCPCCAATEADGKRLGEALLRFAVALDGARASREQTRDDLTRWLDAHHSFAEIGGAELAADHVLGIVERDPQTLEELNAAPAAEVLGEIPE